ARILLIYRNHRRVAARHAQSAPQVARAASAGGSWGGSHASRAAQTAADKGRHDPLLFRQHHRPEQCRAQLWLCALLIPALSGRARTVSEANGHRRAKADRKKSALVRPSYAIIHLHSYSLCAKVEEVHAEPCSAYPNEMLRIDVHACWRIVAPETRRERSYVNRKA